MALAPAGLPSARCSAQVACSCRFSATLASLFGQVTPLGTAGSSAATSALLGLGALGGSWPVASACGAWHAATGRQHGQLSFARDSLEIANPDQAKMPASVRSLPCQTMMPFTSEMRGVKRIQVDQADTGKAPLRPPADPAAPAERRGAHYGDLVDGLSDQFVIGGCRG